MFTQGGGHLVKGRIIKGRKRQHISDTDDEPRSSSTTKGLYGGGEGAVGMLWSTRGRRGSSLPRQSEGEPK